MNKRSYIAIIIEGEDREPLIIKQMLSIHFKSNRFKIISFPAGQNIYMLWKRMQQDDFDTDLIEVVREYSEVAAKILDGCTRDDFSEVFLFFDYDGHQNNLSAADADSNAVLHSMLSTFDNETENGKLYISYPMVEALRDFIPMQCKPVTSCTWLTGALGDYKTDTGRSPHSDVRKYDYAVWKDIVNVFALRTGCLFGKKRAISYEELRSEVSPLTVYDRQQSYILSGSVFVLSAFPEFLLDYFPINFWHSTITHTKLNSKQCATVV